MRHSVPRPARPVAVALAAMTVLALAGGPVVAKEGLEARLDAPIPMGAPGGTELLVGVTVTVPDETGATHPVEGTPIYLKLFGQDGSFTRAAGAADRTPGHYTMRIAMPEGGARDIEIGIHGTSDLEIRVLDEALVLGGVMATTAQVAPPLPPAITPLPRAANPAARPAPATPTTPASAAPGAAAPVPAALGLGSLALLAVGLVVARRRRVVAGTSSAPSAPHSA